MSLTRKLLAVVYGCRQRDVVMLMLKNFDFWAHFYFCISYRYGLNVGASLLFHSDYVASYIIIELKFKFRQRGSSPALVLNGAKEGREKSKIYRQNVINRSTSPVGPTISARRNCMLDFPSSDSYIVVSMCSQVGHSSTQKPHRLMESVFMTMAESRYYSWLTPGAFIQR